MENETPRVALLIETSKSFGRGVLRGVNRYVREHEHWSFYLEPRDLGTLPPPWLPHWRGDGIIARISTPQLADAIQQAKLPTVNLSSANPTLSFPSIETCPNKQAALAAQHLLERGFRSFGFCGDGLQFANWSERVGAAFLDSVAKMGCDCAQFYITTEGSTTFDWETSQARLANWLLGLPKPVGILAINDPTGLQVLEACRLVALGVPKEVAVVGIENDELLCQMADPPLTSVMQHPELVGYRAAEMLNELMKGQRLTQQFVTILPIGVAMRQSTDIEAHLDHVLGTALRYIRQHATSGLTVDQVVRKVNVSRSSLDRRFKAALGFTPHDEIVRTQLRAAMQLLTVTDLNLTDIAIQAGYRHPEYMGAVFRRELGITPGDYRRQSCG